MGGAGSVGLGKGFWPKTLSMGSFPSIGNNGQIYATDWRKKLADYTTVVWYTDADKRYFLDSTTFWAATHSKIFKK